MIGQNVKIGGFGYAMGVQFGEKCRARFDTFDTLAAYPHCPVLREEALDTPWPGYTGPNMILEGVPTDPADALLPASVRKLLRYYVREIKRSGTERRSVYLEVVGTGRTLRMGRRAFERKARAA